MNDRKASLAQGTRLSIETLTLLILLSVISVPVSGGEVAISAGLGWMADARVGVEYSFLQRIGVQAHMGASAARAVTGDVLVAVRLFAPSARTSVSMLVGIPDFLLPFGTNQGMASFGGAIEGRLWFSERFGIALRLGEGFPLFYENGAIGSKALRYPFGLWPDLFVSGVIRLKCGDRR